MQSIKSNALEPTRPELAGLTRWQAIGRILPVYGLPILTLLLIIFFSILLPDTFPTALNVALDPQRQGDHSDALAGGDAADDGGPHRPDRRLRHRDVAHPGDQPAGQVRRPMAAGDSDRGRLRRRWSACSTACWSKWRRSTLSSPRSAPARFSMRSRFGTRTGGRSSAMLPPRLHRRSTRRRSSACRSRPSMCSSWLSCSGSSASACRSGATSTRSARTRRPPRSTGFRCARYVIGVFVGSGLIAGFAGCVLAAKLRIGQANVGLDYLLPALVGAFLGSTTIKPGRVNVWGTHIRRLDPRRRHLRHPATRRRVLRRAPVQWHDLGHFHRAGGLRAAPAHRGAACSHGAGFELEERDGGGLGSAEIAACSRRGPTVGRR